MLWTAYVFLLVSVPSSYSINKPVYKIALTQNGYAQFLQYDVETPPLREFTFCAWVRVFDLNHDQSILTYVANGNNRVVRVWLDTGGRYLSLSIDEKVQSSIPIDFGIDSWRHICLSYQSDHGAWALYIDARLVSCEAAQSLYGYVLPGGGSMIIGYGIANNGIPDGLEGEIYGVNMILTSTIERNYTIKSHPQFKQKSFHRNKITGHDNLEYVVLGNMKNYQIKKRDKPDQGAPALNSSKSYIKFRTPYSFIEHDVGQSSFMKANPADMSIEKEILDIPTKSTVPASENDNVDFWKIINEAGNKGKFKNSYNNEIFSSGTQNFPTISEFETPPPLSLIKYPNQITFNKSSVSFYDTKTNIISDKNQNTNEQSKIPDFEKPPPVSQNTKVYGQWTTSKFANSVLNYLKSINFNNNEKKKVPPTIPLLKVSDSFPYASDIKVSKVRPPLKFQRRNFMDKWLEINKRDVKYPEINVQILKEDLRDNIIESHSKTHAKNVEIINRGQGMKNTEHRFYRNVDSQHSYEEFDSNEIQNPKTFTVISNFKTSKLTTPYRSNDLVTILPFLKSLKYYVENLEVNKKDKTLSSNNMYLKNLSKANKWHNVKSYSNDYTPRQININIASPLQSDIQEKLEEVNKKLPSIRLKYKPDTQKLEPDQDARIIQGRHLASEMSNRSNHNIDSASLIKYNHGFLPGHDTKGSSTKDYQTLQEIRNLDSKLDKNNFHKQVKLGNVLNERNVIGTNMKQNKQSFIGGDEKIPDINRYRSDIDREFEKVPPSLGPKICKNVELYDRLFYVQPDGSIDVTSILSPVREKNTGIEFIMQNYKKCSLENSELEKSVILLIDWNKTPVRLFGGAYPKKTTDLCGFF